jgi:hypothetical protein
VGHVKEGGTFAFILIEFHMLSKQLFFLACNFFLLEALWFVESLSHTEKYLNNLHDTDHLHLIIVIALQVAGPGGYFGVHHGALGQTTMEFTQTLSTMRPRTSHASSFQECDAKPRLGWDWHKQRHDFMDHSHPWRNWQFPTRAVSVANGVFFTTSYGSFNGSIYALDAKTGRVL